jgi:Na+/melibiose symporter-like transporter
MFAVGVFFKIAALTSRSGAGYYYVFFFLLQMIGSSGFYTALSAWGQELARTNEERSQLFTVATFTSLIVSFVVFLLYCLDYHEASVYSRIVLFLCMLGSSASVLAAGARSSRGRIVDPAGNCPRPAIST